MYKNNGTMENNLICFFQNVFYSISFKPFFDLQQLKMQNYKHEKKKTKKKNDKLLQFSNVIKRVRFLSPIEK